MEIPARETYKKYNSLCRNHEILSTLQNDEHTPEFILDGKYYSLPCPLKKFIDDGWVNIRDNKSNTLSIISISIGPEEYALLTLPTSYGSLSLIVCSGSNYRNIEDSIVAGAFYTSNMLRTNLDTLPNDNFFVTKNGLTETTAFQQAQELTAGTNRERFFVWIRAQAWQDPYGNCYDFLTTQLPDDIYELAQFRYHFGYIQSGTVLPDERRFILEKESYSLKKTLSFSAVLLIMLIALIVITGSIACPIIIILIKKNTSEQKKYTEHV